MRIAVNQQYRYAPDTIVFNPHQGISSDTDLTDNIRGIVLA